MSKRRLSLGDYTVGWVCALPIELAAAEEMLDETHDRLDNHDLPGVYTLGRISGHNVVITCLPKGWMGTNSAAAVATRLQSTFPAMRFGVLVGIGGGVPSATADIRLGDVMVSQPERRHGGVVQYDFGKSTPSGLERTGYLNSPPTILLEAVSKLQASHLRGRTRLHDYVAHFTSLPEFASPAAEEDVLFDPDYTHPGGTTCADCDLKK
ncbi:nucleoside phosphorylase domain-containing protein [Aspergillus californicus]